MGAKDALQFRFYSTRHWRTVVEPPIIRDIVEAPPPGFVENRSLAAGQARQVDYAADGADVWVYRNVYDMAGAWSSAIKPTRIIHPGRRFLRSRRVIHGWKRKKPNNRVALLRPDLSTTYQIVNALWLGY